MNEVSSVKQEESKIHIEEKHKAIPCKYFHRIKGCRRGNKCWFSHDDYHKAEKKSSKNNKIPIKKLKNEANVDKEPKQEQGENLKQIIFELVKLLLIENNI